jgi:hypothetical protein
MNGHAKLTVGSSEQRRSQLPMRWQSIKARGRRVLRRAMHAQANGFSDDAGRPAAISPTPVSDSLIVLDHRSLDCWVLQCNIEQVRVANAASASVV